MRSEFLLLVVTPTSALRKALLMISDVPLWYGRETVVLCLVGAVVMVGGVWCVGWGLVGGCVGVGWGGCSA